MMKMLRKIAGWWSNLRQSAGLPKVERVRVDWREVKTVDDIKRILVLMADPSKQPIICNNRDEERSE